MENPKTRDSERRRSAAKSSASSPPAPSSRMPCSSPAAPTSAGPRPRPRQHRRRLARCLHRPVRNRLPRPRRPPGPARPPGTGGNPRPRRACPGRFATRRAPGNRRLPAAGLPPPRRRGIRHRQPRRIRQLHRRRSDRRRRSRSTMCAKPRPAACRGSPARPRRASPGVLAMDAATRASLEILRARDGGPHSLLGAVQRTLTAPGARLLAAWLSAPLTDPAAIARRQDAWGWMLANPHLHRTAAHRPARRPRYGPRPRPAVARSRRPARPRGPARRHAGRPRRRHAARGPLAGAAGRRPAPGSRSISNWNRCSPPRWPIRRRCGWTMVARSALASIPRWMPNVPCATTAAAC